MDIKLNFINRSNDKNNSSVVIFQKNVAERFDGMAVAWTVIQLHSGFNNHPFTFPLEFEIAASDSYGNYTPKFKTSNGQFWEVIRDASGDVLKLSSTPATSLNVVELGNKLPQGIINGNCFKDGKLLAIKNVIQPGQKAAFEFKPSIYIGVVSQIQEGDVMNSAIISQINTEISLFGIRSADIVMTGGGVGPSATPFQFSLEKIVPA